MVTLLFTTSDLIFSKITRGVLGTDCSHFAIGFDIDKPSGIVFHSNLLGVGIDFFASFKVKNRVVHRMDFDFATLEEEEAIYQSLIKTTYKKGYDIGAYLFWGLNLLGAKYFKIEMCAKNLWQSSNRYLCTEIYECLAGHSIGVFTFPYIKNNMLSPHDIYDLLSKWSKIYKGR